MNTFKKKSLAVAVAGASAFALAGAANAVYVNADGIGQALIYPYYTVRDGNSTLLSVVNTSDQAKIVKVRFLEGKNSQEVLDFNLFLSPKDVWTGLVASATASSYFAPGITPTVGGAALYVSDRSCTNPSFRDKPNGVAFRNDAYKIDGGANAGLDRTNEGYLEMLEMADIDSESDLWKDVKHTSANSWTPACKLVGHTAVLASKALNDPTGGLFGSGSIVNPGAGTNSGYNAVAFADWNEDVIYTQPGSVDPNLAGGLKGAYNSVVSIGSNVYVSNWTGANAGRDSVTATLMVDKVMNEYAHLNSNLIGTDWVLTMPTKRFYTNPTSLTKAIAPFQSVWNKKTSKDDFSVADFDREEYSATSVTEDDFSPRPEGDTADCAAGAGDGGGSLLTVNASLCYEANVLGFGKIKDPAKSNVLGSKNFFNLVNAVQNQGVTVADGSGKEGGWATLTFPPGGTAGSASYHMLANSNTMIVNLQSTAAPSTGNATTYYGLPVVGFAVQQLKTANASTSFAAAYGHRFTRSVSDPRIQRGL